tara:strand:+ start:5386 stop:6267 length:882 start_codon:yes stop_codon:yes gene_type:complete
MLALLFLCCRPEVSITEKEQEEDTAISESVPAPVDYGQRGEYAVTTDEGSIIINDTCELEFTTKTAYGVQSPPRVILSHGWARSSTEMERWGHELASWGLEVVLTDLCYNWMQVDHMANAQSLITLNQTLGSRKVVYAGHSFGGLASLLAGADDHDAVGVIGLDPIDTEMSFGFLAEQVGVPVFGIFGESSPCNSEGNGLGLFSVSDNFIGLRVAEADHCDFENPTNDICIIACGGTNNRFSDEEIKQIIQGLFVSAAHGVLSEDSYALLNWWDHDGYYYNINYSSGIIEPIQ